MAAHRYRKLTVTAVGTSGQPLVMSETDFLDGSGTYLPVSAVSTPNGTIVGSVAELTNNSVNGGNWATGDAPPNSVIYDFGTAVDARSLLVYLQTGVDLSTQYQRRPLSFTVTAGDDGTTFPVTELTATNDPTTGYATISNGAQQQLKTFTFGAAPATLTVTGTAGAATVGAAYSAQYTASGGVAPYTYSYTGTIPPGLALNTSTGLLSGTPTTAGSSTFVIHAVDSTT